MPALPYPVARMVDAALVGELTVIGPDGHPITYPMVPLLWGDRIFLTSSVLDSAKVAHVRANPRVSFSITNPDGLGTFTGMVTIQCDARVADPLISERVLIELTPRRTWLWPDGRTDQAPQTTVAAEVAR